MKSKNFFVCFLGIIFIIFSLIGCSGTDNSDINEESTRITLKNGSVLENVSGKYKNYSYENMDYSKINGDEVVASYDYKSNNYIGKNKENYIGKYKNKQVLLNIKNYDSNFNISPNGEYLFFFRNENGLELKVISLKDGKTLKLNRKVAISGKYVYWISDHKLIYYGIKEDSKTNGLFTYDLKTGKEELFMPIEEGYIEFLKVLDNSIVYVQGYFDSSKKLISTSLNGDNKKIISEDIKKVYDIEEINNTFFILGNFTDTEESLYKLENNTYTCLTYAFPTYVNCNKGLVKSDDNNILFVGSQEVGKSNSIYSCDINGAVSKVKEFKGEISFVRSYSIQNLSYKYM